VSCDRRGIASLERGAVRIEERLDVRVGVGHG
jgi:hypothetical protein